jgi:nitrogen-specific signal transduction histidine kinase
VHLLEDTERRREELEHVITSRSRLMRGFTHDIQNPIGAADGHAALLQDGLLGDGCALRTTDVPCEPAPRD